MTNSHEHSEFNSSAFVNRTTGNEIGAFKFPGRKRPSLRVYKSKDNSYTIYGTFQNGQRAVEFMEELRKFLVGERED